MLIKPSLAKNKSDYNYDKNKLAFYKFYRNFQDFKHRSLESKYDDIKKFYMTLKEFKKRDAITTETEEYKTGVMDNFSQSTTIILIFKQKLIMRTLRMKKKGGTLTSLK